MDDESQNRGDARMEAVLAGEQHLPLDPSALARQAKDALDPGPEAFLFGGAGDEATMNANRRAFDRVSILPRVLQGVSSRSLSVTLFGSTLSAPLLLAPIGAQSAWHDEGERATAAGAAAANVPFCLSTVASSSIEDVASEMDDQPRWFQLYWVDDRAVIQSFLQRAEDADYDAIVLTVDNPTMGWRTRILESGYVPFRENVRPENFATDPAFRARLDGPTADDEDGVRDEVGAILRHEDLTWDDVEWLRTQTDLPIVLKGIRHPADAERATTVADGIVVSNHGGRQVNSERGALAVLPEVVDAVDGELPVLFDSGIRTGVDVFKAIALGADAVLLGRPYIYGLSIAGAEGVREVVENVVAELDRTMALSGYDDVTDLDREAVRIDGD